MEGLVSEIQRIAIVFLLDVSLFLSATVYILLCGALLFMLNLFDLVKITIDMFWLLNVIIELLIVVDKK